MIIVPAFISGLGWPEILLILMLVLIFFGPRRLPEIAEAMGKSIRKFKSATNDATREVKRELEDVDRQVRRDDTRQDDARRDDTRRDAPAAEPKREAPRSDDTNN